MEHVTITPAGYRPLAPGAEEMLRAIYQACEAGRVSHREFGRRAISDPALVRDMLRGRELRAATAAKVRATVAHLMPAISPAGAASESIQGDALVAPRFTADALSALPMSPAAALNVLAHFNAEQLGATIEVLVALLDAQDGDPDAETGNDVEDDFELTADALAVSHGAGCAIADSDFCAVDRDGERTSIEGWHGCGSAPGEDDDEESTYPEWHTLPASQRRAGTFQGKALPGDLFGLGLGSSAVPAAQ